MTDKLRRPGSRFKEVLFIDLCCFSAAAGLLLIHFMVTRSTTLLAAGMALLALLPFAAAYEHQVISSSRPAERPTLCLPAWGYLVFFGLVGLFSIGPLATTCLTGAGIGALSAWLAGSDISDAAWLGFFVSLLWCAALAAYGAVKIAIIFLQVRPRFAAGPPASARGGSAG